MNKLLIALVVSIAGCITWLSITLLSEDDVKIPPPIYITECDDVSDELSVKLRSSLIAGLLDTALYQEVNYRGRIIGSVDNREVETFHVPEYDPLVQNPYTRKDAIDSLLGRIDKFYAAVESLDSTVLPNSSIFRPILDELKRFDAVDTPATRILIIRSNLLENLPEFSTYTSKHLKRLRTYGEDLWREHLGDSVDLNGVQVIIIHQNANAEEDIIFRQISAFWKDKIESHGGSFEVMGGWTKSTISTR